MRVNFPIPPDDVVSRRVYRIEPITLDPYTLEPIPERLVLLAEVPVRDENGERIHSVQIPL